MSKFKIGDKVIIAQGATWGSASTESRFAGVAVVGCGPDFEGDYFVRQGETCTHTSERFLTLASEGTRTITNINDVRAGDIATVNVGDSGPYTGPLVSGGDTLLFAGNRFRYADGTPGVIVEFISAERKTTPLPTEDGAVIRIFDTTFNSYPEGTLAVKAPPASYAWTTLVDNTRYKAEEITEWAPVTLTVGGRVTV